MLAITKEIEEYGNIHTNPNYGWGREAYEMVGEWQSHNNVIFSFSKQAKHVDFDRNEKVSVQYPVISRRFIAEKSVLSTQKGTDFSLRSK